MDKQAGQESISWNEALPRMQRSVTSSGVDLRLTLERMCQGLLNMLHAQQVYVYLLEPDREMLRPFLAVGNLLPEVRALFFQQNLHPSTDLLAHVISYNHQPLVSNSLSTDQRLQPSILTSLAIERVMVLPIAVQAELLGGVVVANPPLSAGFTSSQTELAASMASAMALALENVRLYQETHHLLVESQSIQNITLALLQKLDLSEVLQIVCSEAMRLTGALGSSVALLEDEIWLRIAFQIGESGHISNRFSIQDSLWGPVVQNRRTLLVNNRYPEDAPLSPVARQAPFSLLAVPLLTKAGATGVLEVVNKPGGFTRDDARLMGLYAGQAAVAIEHARLYQQVENMAVLEERARISRELHDSVNQSLYAISLYGEAASRKLENGDLEATRRNLSELRSTTKDALGEIRLLIFELRSPVLEEQGLEETLQARLKAVEARANLTTGFKARLSGRLPAELEDTLYRIAQEALNNVLKHANANRVTVHLIQSGQILVLKIEDDGQGFDVPQVLSGGGLGLKGMKERVEAIGGRLTIDSQPGRGTIVMVEVTV